MLTSDFQNVSYKHGIYSIQLQLLSGFDTRFVARVPIIFFQKNHRCINCILIIFLSFNSFSMFLIQFKFAVLNWNDLIHQRN